MLGPDLVSLIHAPYFLLPLVLSKTNSKKPIIYLLRSSLPSSPPRLIPIHPTTKLMKKFTKKVFQLPPLTTPDGTWITVITHKLFSCIMLRTLVWNTQVGS